MSQKDNKSDGAILFLLYASGIALMIAVVTYKLGYISWPSNPRIKELETQVAQLSSEIATLQATDTAQMPTDTAQTPTPTPRVLLDLSVNVAAANVRAGPGVNHEVIDVVERGQRLRGPYSTQKGWHQVCCVDGGKRGWISGELVKKLDPSLAIASPNATRVSFPTRLPTIIPTATPTMPSHDTIVPPPPWLDVAPIYTKYLDANGAHILATDDVADHKMPQARVILLNMTSTRPALFAAMVRTGLKIVIFDKRTSPLHKLPEFKEWPLAGLKAGGFAYDSAGYTVAVPEDDLDCSSVLVHEIAHAIDHAIQPGAPWFSEKRDKAFQNAMAAGIWKGEYAATDKHEYFAVAVERHFRLQAGQAPISKKDPTIAQLVLSVFGDAKIPPCR